MFVGFLLNLENQFDKNRLIYVFKHFGSWSASLIAQPIVQ